MVLSWRLSNTLDSAFCTDALEEGYRKKYGLLGYYSIRIRAVSSQQKHLRIPFVQMAIAISMTARAGGWTTSLSNGYGKAVKYEGTFT